MRANEILEAHPNSKVYDKCWKGYKKVPGKKRGEKGSCVKEENLDNCKHGKYYCSTDKKWKCRQGPKQSRS